MIIDVDLGNTRIKWRSSNSPNQLIINNNEDELFAHWQVLKETVVRVRLASVVHRNRLERLRNWCKQHWLINIEVAEVINGRGGIQLAYTDVAALGVDRWLAMQAAKKQAEGVDLIVVSGGTAITADYLSASGRHLGGYIIPGWRAAVKGLLQGTDRIQADNLQLTNHWQPGRSTQGCVEAGLALTYRAVIQALANLDVSDFRASKMIITGGDGESLQLHLSDGARVNTVYDPLLILRGLEVILP